VTRLWTNKLLTNRRTPPSQGNVHHFISMVRRCKHVKGWTSFWRRLQSGV
jgi:hypothetical protein